MEYIQKIVLDVITILPQIFLFEWLLCQLLPMQHPFFFFLAYGITNILFHTVFLWVFPSSFLFVKPLIMLLLNLLIPGVFCIKKWVSAVSLSTFLYTVLILADILTLAISQYFLVIPSYTSADSVIAAFASHMLLLRCMYLAVLTLFLLPLSFFWNQLSKQSSCYTLWLFPFLIFQSIMLALAEYTMILENRITVALILFLVLIAMLSCVAMCTVLWAYLANNKQHLAALHHIELVSYQRSLQKRSDSIRQTKLQISQLRKELESRIENICLQLEVCDPELAQAQIECTAQFVRQSANHLFCENHTVNAVMQYQFVRCKEIGVHINASLDLPEIVGISDIELCSLFSNIMDNAITACSVLPKAQRQIHISATIREGYLIIKESNPRSNNLRPSVKSLEHSGLGLGILEELAERRNGEVSVESSDTMFRITVWLRIKSSETRTFHRSRKSVKVLQKARMVFQNIAPTGAFLWILLGSQLSTVLLIALYMYWGGHAPLFISAIGLTLLGGCLISGIVLTMFFSRLKKGYSFQQRVKTLEYDLQMQEAHYREIEKTMLNLRRIQHDINNHLQTALALTLSGNYLDAEIHLKHLFSVME